MFNPEVAALEPDLIISMSGARKPLRTAAFSA